MNTPNFPPNQISAVWATASMSPPAGEATSLHLLPVFAVSNSSTQEALARDRARELERLTKGSGLPAEDIRYHLIFFMLLFGVIVLLRKTLVP